MVVLSRNTPALLNMVKGQAHATLDDHEEEEGGARERVKVQPWVVPAKDLTKEQIDAEPVSSSDEIEVDVEEVKPKPALPTPPASNSTRKTLARGNQTGKRKKASQQKTMQVPRGTHLSRRAAGTEENKENKRGTPPNSGEKRKADDEGFVFGMEHETSKRLKPSGGNIHVAYGNKAAAPRPQPRKPIQYPSKKKPLPKQEEEEDCLMKELDEDPSVTLDRMNEENKNKKPPSPVKPPRPDLFATLGAYKQPQSSPITIKDDDSDLSTPPSSQILDQNRDALDVDDLEKHVANLPSEEDPNLTCSLCQQPVDPAHSETFWKYRNRTLRNQSLFCKEHEVRTAQAEYKKEGFPDIDWEALPSRIENLRPELVKLLRNEPGSESKYRIKNETKLLSGKAAVIPTRREGQSRGAIEEALNDSATMPGSTGYYGPRGRRVMMETITSSLSDVIRDVAANDPVVGRSGFAVYVQAVLVPELTVLLVREDFDVSKAMAEELVEKSAKLGDVLHDEVDDVVAVEDEEEREVLDLDDDEMYEAVEKGGGKKAKKGEARRRKKTDV